MKNKKTARKHKSPILGQLMEEITPAEKLQTHTKMMLAARIHDLITARGWSKSEFAEKVDKNPSEITKWLSGTHNFTTDTLAEISVALQISLVELFAPNPKTVINKMHANISIKAAPQSIQYVTPLSDTYSGFSNIFSGVYDNKWIPLTGNLQA